MKNKEDPVAVLIVSPWSTVRSLVKLALESGEGRIVDVQSTVQAREVLARQAVGLMILDTDAVHDGNLLEATKGNESVPLVLLEENGHRARMIRPYRAVRLSKPFTQADLLLATAMALLLSQETEGSHTYLPHTEVKGKRQIRNA